MFALTEQGVWYSLVQFISLPMIAVAGDAALRNVIFMGRYDKFSNFAEIVGNTVEDELFPYLSI